MQTVRCLLAVHCVTGMCVCACGPKSIHTILNSFELNSTLKCFMSMQNNAVNALPRMKFFQENYLYLFYSFVYRCAAFLRDADH